MKRIKRPALLNNRGGTLLLPCFQPFFPFYFTTSSSTTTTGHFALIQLCICILNDTITWDPAEKITGGFHYFFPLGHQDPFPGSNNPPPICHPSLLATLSTCPIMFHSHSHQFFLINIRFAGCIRDWQEIIAKWSCLWALCTVSWQKRRFAGNSSAVTTKQAAAKSFLNLRRDTAQMQTAGMTVIKTYQQGELRKLKGCCCFLLFFFHSNHSNRYVILFSTLNLELTLSRGV